MLSKGVFNSKTFYKTFHNPLWHGWYWAICDPKFQFKIGEKNFFVSQNCNCLQTNLAKEDVVSYSTVNLALFVFRLAYTRFNWWCTRSSRYRYHHHRNHSQHDELHEDDSNANLAKAKSWFSQWCTESSVSFCFIDKFIFHGKCSSSSSPLSKHRFDYLFNSFYTYFLQCAV